MQLRDVHVAKFRCLKTPFTVTFDFLHPKYKMELTQDMDRLAVANHLRDLSSLLLKDHFIQKDKELTESLANG